MKYGISKNVIANALREIKSQVQFEIDARYLVKICEFIKQIYYLYTIKYIEKIIKSIHNNTVNSIL